MYMSPQTKANTTAFLINLLTWAVEIILVLLVGKLRTFLARQTKSYGKRGILYDRRYLIFIQIVFVLAIASSTFYFFQKQLSRSGGLTLISLTSALIIILLLRQLISFWRIGLVHIAPNIARDTYSRALNTVHNSFCIVGTNAFSFAFLSEFSNMLTRLAQCRGEIRILVADPDSNGLIEAARHRGCQLDLYQNQGRASLGKMIELRNELGVQMAIRLYSAPTMEALPIFRAMFLDAAECVASIAVYGRADHGSQLPQIFAKSHANPPQSMYNVVHRYFQGIWDNAHIPETRKEREYLDFLDLSRTNSIYEESYPRN